MKVFLSELQYLSELCDRLLRELSLPADRSTNIDATALTEAILRNRELFNRLEQMDGRISQLSKDWQSFREHLSPQSRTETQHLAEAVGRQADELARLMEKHKSELEEGRRRLKKALSDVRQGARYLASVKPVKTNYPKFVDSLG